MSENKGRVGIDEIPVNEIEVYPYTMPNLLPSQLMTDSLYQRKHSKRHLDHIVSNYNPNFVSFPRVNLRADGKYYVIDGDHTISSHFTKNGDKPIKVMLYQGLTPKQEEEMFLALNDRRYKKFTTMNELLNTQYNFNDPDVSDMVNTAALCGVKVDFERRGSGKCKCNAPDAMFKVYQAYGREILMDTLNSLMAAWDGHPDSLRSGFLQGLARMFKTYGMQVDKKGLIKSLKRNPPDYFIRESKQYSGKIGDKYFHVFVREYNVYRTNKLEDKV